MALHNPRTSSVTLLPTPVSPHILKHTVKALKSLHAMAPSVLQYREARTALGETFGTKKAKAAIRAQERNHVDVGAMEGVVGHLMDGIERGAEGLMSLGECVRSFSVEYTCLFHPWFSHTLLIVNMHELTLT